MTIANKEKMKQKLLRGNEILQQETLFIMSSFLYFLFFSLFAFQLFGIIWNCYTRKNIIAFFLLLLRVFSIYRRRRRCITQWNRLSLIKFFIHFRGTASKSEWVKWMKAEKIIDECFINEVLNVQWQIVDIVREMRLIGYWWQVNFYKLLNNFFSRIFTNVFKVQILRG